LWKYGNCQQGISGARSISHARAAEIPSEGLARRLRHYALPVAGAPRDRDQPACFMTPSEIQITQATPPAAAVPGTAAHDHGFGFHDFLSAMNPLQYLPVVGTIYRAVTGDVIPEAVRDAGSLLVSGLLGGPIGLITYITTTIAEKVTGIDPEKIATAALNPSPPATAVATEVPAAAPAEAPTADPAAMIALPRRALTPQQLAAYGVRSDSPGTLKLGDVEGADVLNLMELTRISTAAAAYAANQPPPSPLAVTGR
jgi:hypothetical protein